LGWQLQLSSLLHCAQVHDPVLRDACCVERWLVKGERSV
jgi:hypothetical protein